MIRFKGHSGELRVGYQCAARLKQWSLEGDAVEVKIDPASVNWFWLARRPLELHLDLGRRRWKWKGVELVSGLDGHAHIILRGERETGG